MKYLQRRSKWYELALLLNAMACGAIGCDPIRLVAVSESITEPLDPHCMLQVLQSSEHVRAAGIAGDGGIWAELAVPANLKLPENRPAVSVDEIVGDDDSRTLSLSLTWVGQSPTPEYRDHVERVMRELAQSCVARCSGDSPQP